MRKLTRLLALALAAMLLLSTGALAAENEEEASPTKLLWMQWIDGDTLEPNTDVHRNNPCQQTPYDRFCIAFYTRDDDGSNPVPVPADQLKADAALKIRALAPGEKGKEHYIEVDCAGCEWGKEYTIAYGDYSFIIDCRLPDVGLYSAPEATTENYLAYAFGFSPLRDESAGYLISTETDETSGRHLVGMALNKDCEDNAAFKLEKISDNVYKLTLTGSVDVQDYRPTVDFTWQYVKFMGGHTEVETRDYGAWEEASVLISDKDTLIYNGENFGDYYEVKDDFRNTLTLKAGEPATVYTALTYFPGDPAKWIVTAAGARRCQTDDANLKLTATDEDNLTKLTVSSDIPGTYTFFVDNSQWFGYVTARYRADGTKYSDKELEEWDAETPYRFQDGEKLLIRTEDNEFVPYEDVYPGEKVAFECWYERDIWAPVTVTVTGEAPKPVFTDVKTSDWFASAVSYANGKGYMNGNEGKFDPTGKITGEQFAQILYNKEGKPAAAEDAAFQGVSGQWYAPAVLWATGKGVITDTGDAAVALGKDLTREQIALMLYNYMGKPEAKGDLTAFTDAAKVSAWAKDAMAWAVGEGVLKGSDNALDPAGTATRAQTAQILMNFFK